jgi:hypothetical protein
MAAVMEVADHEKVSGMTTARQVDRRKKEKEKRKKNDCREGSGRG